MRKTAAFIFAPDNSDEISSHIYCSRTGKAQLTVGGGATAKDPTGVIPIGVDGKAGITAELHFARDPLMNIEVLTGQSLAHHMIDSLAYDFGSPENEEEADILSRIDLNIEELQEVLPAAYEPPPDWIIRPADAQFEGQAGDVGSVAVTIEAPTPGAGYFAVGFTDASEPSAGDISDAWILSVDDNLNVSVITEPSAMPLRIPARM
jgi:hypothetical protein